MHERLFGSKAANNGRSTVNANLVASKVRIGVVGIPYNNDLYLLYSLVSRALVFQVSFIMMRSLLKTPPSWSALN